MRRLVNLTFLVTKLIAKKIFSRIFTSRNKEEIQNYNTEAACKPLLKNLSINCRGSVSIPGGSEVVNMLHMLSFKVAGRYKLYRK